MFRDCPRVSDRGGSVVSPRKAAAMMRAESRHSRVKKQACPTGGFSFRRRWTCCIVVGSIQTNTSLIMRVRDPQDTSSWREFVELYEPLLVSYARSRGLHETDARDVAQEIFINLLRAMPTFELDRRRGRFRTWLWQVTVNA